MYSKKYCLRVEFALVTSSAFLSITKDAAKDGIKHHAK